MAGEEDQVSRRLSVGLIAHTSPSLAEQIRSCMLRAGLSRGEGISAFVLGNPKAWLGTAYHEVLASVQGVGCEDSELGQRIEELWNTSVAKLYERAREHPLDRRFGAPLTWPGYYLVSAMLRFRARELAGAARRQGRHDPEGTSSGRGGVFFEQRLVAFGGKLVGTPDVVRNDEILDYKSGAVFEDEGHGQEQSVKASFIRQLRLYAYLVKEVLGRWPQRGVLIPMVGNQVEVDLEPAACEKEALEAVGMLDRYNTLIHASRDPQDFASPSPEACRWCPYKLICPAFWRDVAPNWSGKLDGDAIEGNLAGPPRLIQGGGASTITMDIQAGTTNLPRIELGPMDLSVHESLSRVSSSDRMRVVGLSVRPDGSLAPTTRTVVARLQDLPDVDTAQP